MKYYSHNGNQIMIAHFPGNTKNEKVNINILEEYSHYHFHKPDNIGIVCAITDDKKEKSYLLKQLDESGYDYYNSLSGHNVLWSPQNKILHVLNSLKMCTEEYALILDGTDVVIMSDLDDIVKRFNTYNKKILYNATIWMYPHIIVDIVENRGQYGQYCFLNAGCAFGKTSDLIEFYEKAWNLVKSDINPISSEQYYIRKVFDTHQDDVFFDWECKIFQCWHKQEYKYENNGDENRCILL